MVLQQAVQSRPAGKLGSFHERVSPFWRMGASVAQTWPEGKRGCLRGRAAGTGNGRTVLHLPSGAY
jgi:hypothetical protein